LEIGLFHLCEFIKFHYHLNLRYKLLRIKHLKFLKYLPFWLNIFQSYVFIKHPRKPNERTLSQLYWTNSFTSKSKDLDKPKMNYKINYSISNDQIMIRFFDIFRLFLLQKNGFRDIFYFISFQEIVVIVLKKE